MWHMGGNQMIDQSPCEQKCPGCGGYKLDRITISVYPGKTVICKHPFHPTNHSREYDKSFTQRFNEASARDFK